MELAIAIGLFVVGLLLIIFGGDWFVDAAAWIAEVSGIPKFIVGATIVSVATTLPELLVSAMAALEGKADMAVGNAIGSVTANLGLILSLSCIFAPVAVRRKDYAKKGIIMIATVAVLLLACRGGSLKLWGSLLLALFLLFIAENISSAKKLSLKNDGTERPTKKTVGKNVVKFVLGTAGIVVGARLMVDKGSFIASALGVPEGVIAVTIIAVGTSLPELVTAVTSIVKKQSSLSIGNILGANIIDNALILPISGLLSGKPLPISTQSFAVDMPVCMLMAALAVVPMLVCSKLSRFQGFVMMALYIGYVVITVL